MGLFHTNGFHPLNRYSGSWSGHFGSQFGEVNHTAAAPCGWVPPGLHLTHSPSQSKTHRLQLRAGHGELAEVWSMTVYCDVYDCVGIFFSVSYNPIWDGPRVARHVKNIIHSFICHFYFCWFEISGTHLNFSENLYILVCTLESVLDIQYIKPKLKHLSVFAYLSTLLHKDIARILLFTQKTFWHQDWPPKSLGSRDVVKTLILHGGYLEFQDGCLTGEIAINFNTFIDLENL